jgi:hypothetical protein
MCEVGFNEGVWNYLKRVELRNVRCSNVKELRRAMSVGRRPSAAQASRHSWVHQERWLSCLASYAEISKVKKEATHLRYFPLFADLIAKVTETLTNLARLPDELTSLQGEYRSLTLPAA